MKAIDFVARTSAGSSQTGVVSSDENVVAIDAGAGQEISLNLRQSDIRSYNREGRNLEIVLSDGRLVILENYFGTDGAPQSRLFISADGHLNEVSMSESGDGQIYAQYGPTEQWGKWSPTEDLIFLDGGDLAVAGGEEDVSMLAAAGLLGGNGLLGALGLGAAGVGGAALMGTGGDGGTGDETPVDPDQPGDGDDGDTGNGDTGDGDIGDGDTGDGDGDGDKPDPDTDNGGGDTGGETGSRIEPSINEPDPIVIGGDDVDPETETITITGRVEPGSSVTVRIGDTSVETVPDDNGDWVADFTGGTFPDDGDHIVTATVTEPDGTETVITGPQVVVDTAGPDISVLEGTVSVDEIINAEEYEAGIEVSGTGEPGAAIVVSVEGVVHETSVAEDGTWSVTYVAGDLPRGEYTTEVTVVSTDAFGNSTTLTDSMQIDTIPHDLVINTGTVEGDGVINFVENEDGFTLTGSSAPGAMVTVEIEGVSQTVEVAQDGRWSADFAAGTVPGGEYDADVTATTQDGAGNVTVTTGAIGVDTVVNRLDLSAGGIEGDNVVNAAEARDGVQISGQVEPGSTVSLDAFGKSYDATVAANGAWALTIPAADVVDMEATASLIISATDPAGNIRSMTQQLSVDTVIPDQPDIVGAFRQTGGGYRSVTTETTGDAVSIHQVDSSGNINELSLHVTEDAFLGETNHLFLGAGGTPQSIPDGSELIITNTDAAGNASSTYVVLDETSTNALDAASLATSGFNIDEIDLGLGDQRELTITEEQLVALSQNGDLLIVRGGSDDTVTLTGAEAAGQTQIEGETFNLYTLGTDGASVMIEEDVNVNGLI